MRGVKPIENRTVKNCVICGNEYLSTRDDQLYCSSRCGQKAWRIRSYPYVTLKCEFCGKEFIRKHSRQRYCCKDCKIMSEAKSKKVIGGVGKGWSSGMTLVYHTPNRICDMCGRAFFKRICYLRRNHIKNFCSNTCRTEYIGKNVSNYPEVSRRSKMGKRADLGIFVRSAWEANYARYLNWLISLGEIVKWEYEADTFEFEKIKKGTRFYTPDFKITNNDGSIEYHEVKGYMDDKSKTKIKRFCKYYPDIKLVIIDKEFYVPLSNQMRNLIPNWEVYSNKY